MLNWKQLDIFSAPAFLLEKLKYEIDKFYLHRINGLYHKPIKILNKRLLLKIKRVLSKRNALNKKRSIHF